ELERVALPELERRGRLHVEVAVDEHGGRVGRTGGSPELAEREKPLAERRELGRPARGTDEGADPLAGAAHVVGMRRVGAHARNAEELAELGFPHRIHDTEV